MKKFIIAINLFALLTINVYSQWTQLSSPTSSNLNTVTFTSYLTGYIGGSLSGSILKTTNGGASWIFLSSGSASAFNDIFFSDANNGLVAGSSGTVAKTTNAGANWSITLSGSATFYSIGIALPSFGNVVGGNPSAFYKTTDFGNTWIAGNPPSSNVIRGSQLTNATAGWVCGDGGLLMKTTDGGTSWIGQNQSSSYNFQKIIMMGPSTGFVFGSGGVIMKTTNSGTNWMQQSSGISATIYGAVFTTANNGWAVGGSGKIINTTDGGNNWYPQNSPSSTATFTSIKMVDSQYGYIVGSGGIILKTINGGGPPVVPCFTKVTNDPLANIPNYGEGCAWGDYDNDGYQDLVVTNYNDNSSGSLYPIYLFHNNGDGTFTRVTTGPIANTTTRSFGCSWGDYDNDGKLDLFVTVGWNQTNLLFHNEGNGNFTQITSGIEVNEPGWSTACAWIDYDRDGWLDLLVINQYNYTNFLYHNNGNGTFTKITNQVICNTPNWARACAIGDYDNDGWPDVYVVNYQGQSDQLYHNNNGVFGYINANIDQNWGSGAIFGDYDNDGCLDLFVTNNNAQNILYRNNGDVTFTRVYSGPGNDAAALSYGCTWVDYNNDGNLDLFVSNKNNYAYLYLNSGNGTFSRITNEIVANDYMYGIGNSTADVNLDGKMDLFSDNNGSGSAHNNLFYKNTCQNIGNYIGIKLKGCMPQAGYSNRDGIGARINVYAGGKKYIREVTGGSGYHSESMLWQNVGVGLVNNIDSIVVKWPSNKIQKLTNIAVNQYVLIDECLVGVQTNSNNIPKRFLLHQNYPNPFNPTTKIKYQLPEKSFVNLEIFNYLGDKVSTLVNNEQAAGYYEVEFSGINLGSGVYFYKITTGNFDETKKMVLIK